MVINELENRLLDALRNAFREEGIPIAHARLLCFHFMRDYSISEEQFEVDVFQSGPIHVF